MSNLTVTAQYIVRPARNCLTIRSYFQKARAANDVCTILETEQKNREHRDRVAERLEMEKTVYQTETNHMEASLQILGSGACGAARSLCLTVNGRKYLFNCGEGLQRQATEYKCKLSKVNNLFITTPIWKNIGGIAGLLISLHTISIPQITLHASVKMKYIMNAMKSFAFLHNIQVLEAATNDLLYHDDVLRIWYVPILNSSVHKLQDDSDKVNICEEEYCNNITNSNGKRLSDSEESKAKILKSENSRNNDINTYCYICKLHSKKSALSVEKCIEKGVTSGRMYGQLKNGEDVTLDDGTVVKSSDVCIPSVPGKTFMVVECPTENHLDAFVNNPTFEKHQITTSDKSNIPEYIFHFTSQKIMNDPRYKNWMNKFGTADHIIINDSNNCMGSMAVHKYQHMLHLLHPDIFPLLDEEGIHDNTDIISAIAKTGKQQTFIHTAKAMYTFGIAPKKWADVPVSVLIEPHLYLDEIKKTNGFSDALDKLKIILNKETSLLTNKSEYPKVVMLGTASSVPNKIRNTSGILLRLNEQESILLDCAEGTLAQIIRFYGKSKADRILASIKAIFISHLHIDHHFGLIGLLKQREQVTKERVLVFVPNKVLNWLQFYSQNFEPVLNQVKAINNNFLLENTPASKSMDNLIQATLSVSKINTCFVKHSCKAYGISITSNTGQKIVYSGDTMPCESLIALGRNCDLLIHESTMGDEFEHDAVRKCHSTISQAVNAGITMNAKFILLTHFSQRYSKYIGIPEKESAIKFSNVGVAYDFMQFSLGQFPLLPLFRPILKIMFDDENIRDEN